MFTDLARLKNRLIARLATRFLFFKDILTARYKPSESKGIPWTPVRKPLRDSMIAVVTAAGVHHRDQKPFDMKDPNGDPTFRQIDVRRPLTDLVITHDYYDHSDADRDINIVFPVENSGNSSAKVSWAKWRTRTMGLWVIYWVPASKLLSEEQRRKSRNC